MLEVSAANTYYGEIQALRDVSLSVREGEIVALIGSNGAGKTTLLNTISGVLPARGGEIIFMGQRITHLSAEKIVSLGISHVPERRQVFATMSVLDNLLLGAYHRYGKDSKSEIQQRMDFVFGVFPVLKERRRQHAGTLSGGEQQMLALGRGLMAKPQLLLLDEPSLGLAPLLVRELMRVVVDLRQQGTTILLVEQNAKAALSIADRGYVMEAGQIALEGTAEELLADGRVQRVYLGRGHQQKEV